MTCVSQWPCSPTLTYRCGGSVGVSPIFPFNARLGAPVECRPRVRKAPADGGAYDRQSRPAGQARAGSKRDRMTVPVSVARLTSWRASSSRASAVGGLSCSVVVAMFRVALMLMKPAEVL